MWPARRCRRPSGSISPGGRHAWIFLSGNCHFDDDAGTAVEPGWVREASDAEQTETPLTRMPREDARHLAFLPGGRTDTKSDLELWTSGRSERSGRARFLTAIDELFDRHVAAVVERTASAAGAAGGELLVDLFGVAQMNGRPAGRTPDRPAAECAATGILECRLKRDDHGSRTFRQPVSVARPQP